MKRMGVRKGKSTRKFVKRAEKTAALNLKGIPRGGIRL